MPYFCECSSLCLFSPLSFSPQPPKHHSYIRLCFSLILPPLFLWLCCWFTFIWQIIPNCTVHACSSRISLPVSLEQTAHSMTWFLAEAAVWLGMSAVPALEMSPVIRWHVKKLLSFVCWVVVFFFKLGALGVNNICISTWEVMTIWILALHHRPFNSREVCCNVVLTR